MYRKVGSSFLKHSLMALNRRKRYNNRDYGI